MVSKENVKAFMNGLKKFGEYSKVPNHWWTYPVPEEWKDDVVPPSSSNLKFIHSIPYFKLFRG